MVVVPLSKFPNEFNNNFVPEPIAQRSGASSLSWVRFAAACSLGAGGVLLLAGRRREGLLAAATGTALALLDQQDMLRKWWTILPEYIGDVQRLLDQTQSAVEEFSTQRQKLGEVLGRQRN
jgi:hypothetical protein